MYSDTGTSAHIIIHNPGTFDRDALLDYFHMVETRAEPALRGKNALIEPSRCSGSIAHPCLTFRDYCIISILSKLNVVTLCSQASITQV